MQWGLTTARDFAFPGVPGGGLFAQVIDTISGLATVAGTSYAWLQCGKYANRYEASSTLQG